MLFKPALALEGKPNSGLDLNKAIGESDTENETCDLYSNEERWPGEFCKLLWSGDHLLAGGPPYPQLHPIAATLAP